MVAILEKSKHNADFHPMVDFIEASPIRYALTVKPTIYVSHIRQFWSTARIETTEEGTQILAIVDGIHRTVTESSLRRNLKLKDEIVPLFDTMLVQQGEGSGTPTEPHHTPSLKAQPPSHTTHSLSSLPPVTTTIPTVTPFETTPIRQYTRRARIAQSFALLIVADEPESPLRDISQGEACPIDSDFIADQDRATIAKSSTLPHDSAPRVTSYAAEGSMQQTINELTALCTSLQRQYLELAVEFEAQGIEITRLKAKLKLLEDRQGVAAEGFKDDAPIKGRSLDEGEAAAERISDDTKDMATVLTSMDAATVLPSRATKVPTGSRSIPTAGPSTAEVPTGSDVVLTTSLVFSTATVVTLYRRRKGKEVMVEFETPKKQKEEAKRIKRKGLSLEQESAKKQKTSEEVIEEAKSSDEVLEENVKEMMQMVPIEEVYVEALQVKHPIIDWKDKEIFMLVEKDYPLRKGLALVMISYKLQVLNYSQMVNDLILKIYKIANYPRQQGIEFPLAVEVPTASEEGCHCQKKRDATARKITLLSKLRRNFMMADNRTMEEMLQAPTEGYGDAIVFRDVPNDAIKIMLFTCSLEGAAKIWYEKEPPRSILTWEDLNQINSVKNESRTDISNQINELRNMMASYFQMNTASSSGSGSLPSNIEVDREPEKITDQVLTESTNNVPPLVIQPSLVSTYSTPISSSKMPEVTKDTIQPSTENIQPPVAQTQIPIDELVVAPKPKPTIPYPSRANKQKLLVDYVVDPCVPLILRRPFLRTGRALIDVYGKELTLRVDDEAITFKVGQTSRYSYNNAESINRVDVIDIACEEYVQKVLGFFDNSKSGNPTPISDPIIALSSPYLTHFKGGDFILEEIGACLISKSIPLGIDDTDFDLEGDIRLLEELLNKDPSSYPLSSKELNVEEIKTVKSSIDEPPKLELKELSSYLEYTFLYTTNKLPVIISKELKDDEKSPHLKILKSHKWAIAWKIFDIKRIDPHFYTHKILMEDDFKPAVQHQRRVNPKIDELIKKEVIKLLDARLNYPIFDSPWVSPVHCLPKKGGMTIVENEDNELIPTRHVPKVHDGHFSRYDRENDGGLYGRFFDFQIFFLFVSLLLRQNATKDELEKKEITEAFPLETLGMIAFRGDSSTSCGQVEVSNRGLKRILERTVGENRASWSDKLDDALWAFRTAFKTPIGCTPYKLVYRKACHLPVELVHKAYWVSKHCNFDLKTAGDHQKVQLIELNELRDQAYENSLIYKEKKKKIHDSKIKNRVFNVGDRVLFNSRLNIFLRKLKTCWTRPFTVAHVFPYGTIELSYAAGLNFKVNGHRLKHYFGGDIPQLVVPDLQNFPMDQ
nr:reverse transcriptase domain-containing protein [Tanacetum cinerariifolium]